MPRLVSANAVRDTERVRDRFEGLKDRYNALDGVELLSAIAAEFPGKLAVASSFGATAAVLLDMVTRVDPSLPVLLLNTGKLFGETLDYRDELVRLLGLHDVREVRPHPGDLAEADPSGRLWSSDPDRCCFVRKVAPLNRALMGFDAWATGRTRARGGVGPEPDAIEMMDGRVKINPIAGWAQGEIEDYLTKRNLPPHPMVADGFLSIGCLPCTDAVLQGEDARAGRWRGFAKTECGIHLGREVLLGLRPQTNP